MNSKNTKLKKGATRPIHTDPHKFENAHFFIWIKVDVASAFSKKFGGKQDFALHRRPIGRKQTDSYVSNLSVLV